MEPYAQLIVYHFMDNGTWSADSVYFNVNDGALIFKNKVRFRYLSKTTFDYKTISRQNLLYEKLMKSEKAKI